MNTAGSSSDAKAAGGYGNVEFNGLPATSNGYILDGYDSNDPWLGLNIGLSTNLVIGLDAVDQATVNTNSYSVDQGRYAASQVNYFTKSGTNKFHGDLYEMWNGSLFNAEDYFLHANDTPGNIAKKPRSVVNEFGVSVGGPIAQGQAVLLRPLRRHSHRIAAGHADDVAHARLSAICAGPACHGRIRSHHRDRICRRSLRRFRSIQTCSRCCPRRAARRCPLFPARWTPPASLLPAPSSGTLLDGSGCATQRQESLNNSDTENLIVVKIDHTINAKDSIWYRFQQDTGLQAEWTDPINSIFNSYSPQPQRTLVVGYTHLFSPALVNQFNPGASWYSSIFEPNNYSQVAAELFPSCSPRAATACPSRPSAAWTIRFRRGARSRSGRSTTTSTWTRGRHTLHFGVNTRRIDTSDYDLGEGTVPTVDLQRPGGVHLRGRLLRPARTFPFP